VNISGKLFTEEISSEFLKTSGLRLTTLLMPVSSSESEILTVLNGNLSSIRDNFLKSMFLELKKITEELFFFILSDISFKMEMFETTVG
jgi:hypothetical protein